MNVIAPGAYAIVKPATSDSIDKDQHIEAAQHVGQEVVVLDSAVVGNTIMYNVRSSAGVEFPLSARELSIA